MNHPLAIWGGDSVRLSEILEEVDLQTRPGEHEKHCKRTTKLKTVLSGRLSMEHQRSLVHSNF